MTGDYGAPNLAAVLQLNEVERALAVMAHPDDVDFSAAGIVGKLTDAGANVTYCLVTDGQAGGFDRAVARPTMAAIRREEQTKAAAELGVSDLIFLGRMDGEVVFDLGLRHDITRVVRQVRPQIVITHPPEIVVASVYGSHVDHVATGQATWAAVYPDAGNPFAFPELLTSGLEPWEVDEVWLINHPNANLVLDITDQFDRKLRALRCHASQHRDAELMAENVRTWNLANAQASELSEGSLAERFFVAQTR
jgi:LmbE family N-acetylglucosaminyl deacetylase